VEALARLAAPRPQKAPFRKRDIGERMRFGIIGAPRNAIILRRESL
jgi:hypothetical protein